MPFSKYVCVNVMYDGFLHFKKIFGRTEFALTVAPRTLRRKRNEDFVVGKALLTGFNCSIDVVTPLRTLNSNMF